MVPTTPKLYSALIHMTCSLDLSASTKVLSLSNTEFSLSRTESLASEISSIKRSPPCCMDWTRIPSCHSKIRSSWALIAWREGSWTCLRHSSIWSIEDYLSMDKDSQSFSLTNEEFFFVLIEPRKSEVSVFWCTLMANKGCLFINANN